jgi:hypothetical protein
MKPFGLETLRIFGLIVLNIGWGTAMLHLSPFVWAIWCLVTNTLVVVLTSDNKKRFNKIVRGKK